MTRLDLVLASASPTRARLLKAAGLKPTIEPADIDETTVKATFQAGGRDPGACAMALAEAKAQRIASRMPGALVLGADQLLVCDGAWFDKPKDRAAARAQLAALRGKRHVLPTAAALVKNGATIWHTLAEPALTMRRFSDAFLDDYLAAAGDAALGSVGAYQIEGRGIQLMAEIEGDHFAILGLPLLPLLAFLRDSGALTA
ncbi:MAG: septum formation protein Maf [Alphaproteobacteria bacterium]|nr:septum formation protein Maf [Alphaproteobacteria bacterium]